MEKTNTVPFVKPAEDDPDCFIRLCNSHAQEQKRIEMRRRDRRRQTIYLVADRVAFAVVVTAITALIIIAL